MSIKTLLITLSVVLIIGSVLGWFARGCSIPKTLPAIKKDSTYVERTELQPVKKDSTVSTPLEKIKTQKRVDKISVKDSLGQTVNLTAVSVVVNDSLFTTYSLELIPVRFIMKQITEIIKPTLEYVEAPWYANNWFYGTLAFAALLILSLLN
ncbi:MAG: hypothetical protein A2499_05080 [Stygiobacter sp. RIFOXYC12_FULL_38_8]|nr:MAG: hypothetical protein A2299_16445 [Stygiobacter sp. RIFOXYB2_FULL_37_11]OGV13497.1 MAG: hypothetical protein A2237_17145 [Stygiobacter sp. RIFOXYA2_FULL_38_8]OGV14789.1 MAG: hypothetical protein A2440_09825 [Stygiobacter sp. RIFOXYC2_FULL_38_25]OGV22323.1 MAG: hypothetical protein A2499_05080 [Stygiobacter sp. RIFOXYC12_FULL_38_8]OGV79282.1 MAG: hypothetical protein A2X65_02195 [Stygiobacter sp. GWF2_38_21]